MQSLDYSEYGSPQGEGGSAGQIGSGGLLELIDKVLDKGLVINGDVTIALAGAELLSLRINLVIASLETAKRYGIELPWEKWNRIDQDNQELQVEQDGWEQTAAQDGNAQAPDLPPDDAQTQSQQLASNKSRARSNTRIQSKRTSSSASRRNRTGSRRG
ncbi:MAG: gas vesicle protein [Nitrososphaera sp.]